jgi:hypothetical protein
MLGIANFVMSINDVGKEMKQQADSIYNRVTSYQKYLQTFWPNNLQMITDLQAMGFNSSSHQPPVIDHIELYSEEDQYKFSVASM